MPKSKAVAVQLATPEIDEFAKYSLANVRAYCSRHGYAHYVQRRHTVPGMHINWSKIDLLRHVFTRFPEAEYFILFDADIIVQDFSKSIDYFLDKYGDDDTHIFFAADTPLRLSLKARPNAGLIILKNSEIGKKIIDRWIEASVTDGAKYNDTHPRNQLVYWNCVMPRFEKYQKVLPRSFFVKPLYVLGKQIMPTAFLYHLTQSDKSTRAREMKRMSTAVRQETNRDVKETEKILAEKKDYLLLREAT